INIGSIEDRFLLLIKLAQFTIGDKNVVHRLGDKPAIRTNIRSCRSQISTARAFFRKLYPPRFCNSRVTIAKFRMMDISDKSQTAGCVTMIQYQTMIFSRRRTQTATNDLYKQDLRFSRPRQYNASYVPIDAGGQNTDIADDLIFAGCELVADLLAFF